MLAWCLPDACCIPQVTLPDSLPHHLPREPWLLCWPCWSQMCREIYEGSHGLFSASHTPWSQSARGQNHKSHFTDERSDAQRGGLFHSQIAYPDPYYLGSPALPKSFWAAQTLYNVVPHYNLWWRRGRVPTAPSPSLLCASNWTCYICPRFRGSFMHPTVWLIFCN